MRAASGQWDDLLLRVVSGGAVAVIGLLVMWAGGVWFHGLVALICAGIIWELVRMHGPAGLALAAAVFSGAVLMIATELAPGYALPLILAPALIGIRRGTENRVVVSIFAVLVLLAGFEVAVLRDDFGFGWVAWLALVVIATDIFGYFAGRMLGGPKFWPAVSPKKTWAGTVAGWIAAAAVGAVFARATGAGGALIGLSVALSMASQLGDIAESALKRRAGVKDSSALLPGHGGLFDRFDGMLGASVFLLLVQQIADFPPVPA